MKATKRQVENVIKGDANRGFQKSKEPDTEPDEDAGSGTCVDCGHKFNKFSSTDFTGKLCNDCFAKTGASYGTGIGT